MTSDSDVSVRRRHTSGGWSRPDAEATPTSGWWRFARLGGIVLLVASGVIHFDLYLTGYNTLPTIGWLFLLQVIADVVIAIALLVVDSRLVAAAGAGLVLSTLIGYLVALRVSLFGFREVRTPAGVIAAIIEIVGFAVLATFALRPYDDILAAQLATWTKRARLSPRIAVRIGRWIAVVLTVQAALTLALLLPNSSPGSTNSSGSHATLNVRSIHGVSVLTNARGYTLYWFAPDSAGKSRCYSICAAYWPPVTGVPVTSSRVAGTFTTVLRKNGKAQVTYDGHPLYTYVGDSKPGQATGNRVNLNGGFWYEMKVAP
jgi:predicted lipoprotein with Yx(FWY)xxD motif